MKYIYLILMIFELSNKICSKEENSTALLVAISSAGGNESDSHGGISKSSLSSKDFTEIHDLAKNISHSKGIYREGDGDKNVRRSIINKATVASESDIMKKILMVFNTEEDKLQLLRQMEDMVHQYDVAINFATMGGMKIISPLLFSSNVEIVSSVALVLGSAMQSNPTVQKLAVDQNIGEILLDMLSHKSPVIISRVVFALSSFLRNSPEAQERFLSKDGVSKLADILKDSIITTNIKLKIIDLFSDLAVEHESTEQYQLNRSDKQTTALTRSFIDQIQKFDVCNHITSFLSFEDYDTHQKTIAAMLSLFNICHKSFKQEAVKLRLEKLLKIYHPVNSGENPVYPYIDSELTGLLYSEIQILYEKVNEISSNISFQLGPKLEL